MATLSCERCGKECASDNGLHLHMLKHQRDDAATGKATARKKGKHKSKRDHIRFAAVSGHAERTNGLSDQARQIVKDEIGRHQMEISRLLEILG